VRLLVTRRQPNRGYAIGAVVTIAELVGVLPGRHGRQPVVPGRQFEPASLYDTTGPRLS